jgi:hypothetical protein
MGQRRLTIADFLAVCEMVASQLRIKESDRWGETICRLKFSSFCSEFPEVSTEMLLWAAEQWIQSTAGKDFLRYPTWRELMAPLYCCKNGLAHRAWGFSPNLPKYLAPTPAQLALLPTTDGPPPPPDPANAAAYQLVGAAAGQRLLAPASPQPAERRLTQQEWDAYLAQAKKRKTSAP